MKTIKENLSNQNLSNTSFEVNNINNLQISKTMTIINNKLDKLSKINMIGGFLAFGGTWNLFEFVRFGNIFNIIFALLLYIAVLVIPPIIPIKKSIEKDIQSIIAPKE
jgi:hypothetical protein